MTPTLIVGSAILVTAASLGSFINVLAARLPMIRQNAMENGRPVSLSYPDSRCPVCKTRIRWHQNIPVLAWLVLRGRCAACKTSISPSYPLVEAGAAALGGLTIYRLGVTPEAVLVLALLLALYALAISAGQHPITGRLTRWPLLAITSLPALLAGMPWLVGGLDNLSAIGPQSISGLGVAVALVVAVEAVLRGYRPVTLHELPVLLTAVLAFPPLIAAALWLLGRFSTFMGRQAQGEPVAAVRVSSSAIALIVFSIIQPKAGQILTSPTWGALMHTTP